MAISKVIYKSSPNATPETWMDATPATAAAADIIAPKTAMLADGLLTVGTGSGGGASNVVTGKFKGTNSNSALDVPISYSGSGYPIAVIIYPTEGPYNPNTGTFYNLVLRYAISMICVLKNESDTTPDYAGGTATKNKSTILGFSKSSTSSATSYSTFNKQNETVYDNSSATGSNYFKLKSKSAMSVYILGSGSNRGFAVNIEYTYHIIYSS